MDPDRAIRPGDVLSVGKGLYRHLGVAMPRAMVLTNTPPKGEHLCSYEDFAEGKTVQIQQTPEACRDFVVANARRILAAPKAYSLLQSNCEHTVHRALGKAPRSPQLRLLGTALASVLAVATLAFVTRRPRA